MVQNVSFKYADDKVTFEISSNKPQGKLTDTSLSTKIFFKSKLNLSTVEISRMKMKVNFSMFDLREI
jgi:hypothetical protein